MFCNGFYNVSRHSLVADSRTSRQSRGAQTFLKIVDTEDFSLYEIQLPSLAPKKQN